jgi:hypothetical protein
MESERAVWVLGGMAKAKEKQFPETMEIEHRRASGFGTHWVDGAVVTAPVGPDLRVSVTFFADAVNPTTETLRLRDQDDVAVRYQPESIETETVREDQVRILMSMRALDALKDLIEQRLQALRDAGLWHGGDRS